MLVPVVLAALMFQAGVPSSLPPLAPELVAEFEGLLRSAPAFTKRSGRDRIAVRTGAAMPDTDGKVWFVEFQWMEKGVTHTGIAGINDAALLKGRDPTRSKKELAQHGRWALMAAQEDTTWDDMIKGLQAARISANEAATIGDIRSIIAAQAVYLTVAGGYGEPACLIEPANCIPGYTGPAFLYVMEIPERMGYRRFFHAGAAAAPKRKAARPLKAFAFSAVPLSPDSGRRAFCGDSTGKVCTVADGAMPAITGGACPASCMPLP